MRILFLMDSPEYLRFYDSAVEALVARGHEVALAVNSGRAKKPVGLEGLRVLEDRLTVLGVVPEHTGRWAGIAHGLRATMDFVRFLHPAFASAPVLRARIKRKVLPRAYHWLDAIPQLGASTVAVIERMLAAAERSIPVSAPIVQFLRDRAPDVLLVSPLVAAASPQVDWIKAARACGIRTAVCIASWDNLTNKGLLRIEPDLVIVWNEAQKREAVELHYMPAGKVAVTGAQLFDRWFETRPARDRAAFCRRAGLPDDRPFVVFAGSSGFISESGREVAFVRRWIEALRASGDPDLRAINILVRPHPYNCHRWEDAPLAGMPGAAVFPGRAYNPVTPESRADYFDTLYHAAAVVGINTSAMVEAAIIGRPVCTILAEEFAATQEGTVHFRHLLPEHGGFVRLAVSMEAHLRQLGDCLRHPETTRAETSRFVASFIRPHGVDRPATPIFVEAVERLGALSAPVPERPPRARVIVRPLLLAAAAPIPVVNRIRRTRPLHEAHTRVRRAVRVVRKVAAKTGSRWRRYFDQAW